MSVDIKSAFQQLADDKRHIREMAEIIKNRVFLENVNSMFNVIGNVKAGYQVAAMKGLEYVTKKDDGCGGEFDSPDIPALSQYWNPKLAKVGMKYCYTDLMNFFTQWGLNNGYAIKDLTDTDFAIFMEEFVTDAMQSDLQRLVLLGNEDIATDAELKDSTKAQYYDVVPSGLIKTLQYFNTITELSDNFVNLSANSQTDGAGNPDQLNFSNGYAKDLYRKLTRDIDFEESRILSSRKLYENYEDYFESLDSISSQPGRIKNGQANLSRAGVPIIATRNYDRWVKRDFKATFPRNFAIHTAQNNLQVGVDSEASLTDLTFEYVGGSDEHFYIKANYMVDFKIPNPYEIKAAL